MKSVGFEARRWGRGSHRCDWCGYTTTSQQEMTTHVLTHAHHSCPKCGLALARPSALRHHLKIVHNTEMRMNNEKAKTEKFICKVCGKEYASAGGLHSHMIGTHSGKVYGCKECGRKFNHPKNLASHVVRHKERYVKCTECEAAFYLRSELNKHINQVHRKCRPYVCVDCGRSFCQRSVLKHHRMVHSDHRPLTCPLCGRTFKHRQAFNYHLEQERKLARQTVALNQDDGHEICTVEPSQTSVIDSFHTSEIVQTHEKSTGSSQVQKVNVMGKKSVVKCATVKSGRKSVIVNTKSCRSLEFISPLLPSTVGSQSSSVTSQETQSYPDIQLFENNTYNETLDSSNSCVDSNSHIMLVTDMNETETEIATFVLERGSGKVLEVEDFKTENNHSVHGCHLSGETVRDIELGHTEITCMSETQPGPSRLDSESSVTQYIKEGISDCCVLGADFISVIDPVNGEVLAEKDST